jgi:hypothetical protein
MRIKKLAPEVTQKLKAEKIEKLALVHSWFAWYPVRIDITTVAWLEKVNRRAELGYTYKGERAVIGWRYSTINSR